MEAVKSSLATCFCSHARDHEAVADLRQNYVGSNFKLELFLHLQNCAEPLQNCRLGLFQSKTVLGIEPFASIRSYCICQMTVSYMC